MFHIIQIIENCHYITAITVRGILQLVEIWRLSYALSILKIIRQLQVFGDIDAVPVNVGEEQSEFDMSVLSGWSPIKMTPL